MPLKCRRPSVGYVVLRGCKSIVVTTLSKLVKRLERRERRMHNHRLV